MRELPQFEAYINGQRVKPQSGEYFETINPYTSKAWAEVARCDERDADAAVDAAHHAFSKGDWLCI